MEFVAGVCPQCGGEIQLDPHKESGYCLHCGVKIYTKDAIQPDLDKKRLANYIKLAEEAIESGNQQEAVSYANRALEIDSSSAEAWFIKMQISKEPQEIKNCISNIIDNTHRDKLDENLKNIWAFITPGLLKRMDEIIGSCEDTKSLRIECNELRLLNDKTAIYSMLTKEYKRVDELAESVDNLIVTYREIIKLDFRKYNREKAALSYWMAEKFIKFVCASIIRANNYKGKIVTYGSLTKVLESILKNVPVNHAKDLRVKWQRLSAATQSGQEAKSNSNKVEIKIRRNACYIATAVYGSYDAPNVMVLRRYRDRVLSKNVFGRMFIKIYYKASPPVAERLKHHHMINELARKMLDSWVSRIKVKYHF